MTRIRILPAKCTLIVLFALLLAAGVFGVGERARAAAQNKPNIVILFADDMGYGDLSCYGNPVIETPNLDSLANQGTRFKAFYTGAWCVPSRTQLLTGRYKSQVNFHGGTGAGGGGHLPQELTTLAEGLKQAGYATHMLGKWHLGYKKDAYRPHEQGFDTWWGLPYSNDMRKPWVQTDVPLGIYQGKAGEGSKIVEHPVNQDTLTTRYTEKAVERISTESGKKDEPFFLYLAYDMPHLPIHTADRFRGESNAGLYGDVIETIDWSAGRIMETLEARGIAKNTIVFFASDNGPWLNLPDRMLQAGNKPWHAGTTGMLRGSKATSYEGGPRVPAIIRWPGHIKAGVATEGLAASQDIYQTFMAIGGAEAADATEGHNLMPWLTGEQTESPRKTYACVLRGRLQAFRRGPWKLRLEGDQPQLFQLKKDPAERWNRVKDKPDRVKALRAQMKERASQLNAKMP